MNKYQLLHAAALIASGSLIGVMLVSRLEGLTGHLTDIAVGLLAAGCAWHVRVLVHIARP